MANVPFEFFSFLIPHWVFEAAETNPETKKRRSELMCFKEESSIQNVTSIE